MKSHKFNLKISALQSKIIGSSLVVGAQALAGMTKDQHGNVGYDTAVECDAAVLAGTAKLYRSFTSHPPLKRAGEVIVKSMLLGDLSTANYSHGACDIGVGRSNGRDGVSQALMGKFVSYGPTQVMERPASTREIDIPATFETLTNQLLFQRLLK